MHAHGSNDRPQANAADQPYTVPADEPAINALDVEGGALLISLPAREIGPSPGSYAGIRRFLASLGPGVITGAADDDPSAITTYSIAGAAYGCQFLWTAVFVFPLLAAVQLMCARLGMVSGQGLASMLRLRYRPWVAWCACGVLITANTCQIAADLSGMGEVLAMLTGVSARWWPPVIATLLFVMMSRLSYRDITRAFKWLALALIAYVGAAVLAKPDWLRVAKATFVPSVPWSVGGLTTLVAILGSAISPYIFFWQTAQMVEDERILGRTTVRKRRGATADEMKAAVTGRVKPAT